MFACILILILLLPVASLPLAIATLFSSSELNDMGVCLEESQTLQSRPLDPNQALICSQGGRSCLLTRLSI